jgi:Uma2 family endonuclease
MLLTAEEYSQLQDPPGQISELVRGVIVYMPPPSFWHGKLCARIVVLLAMYVDPRNLGSVTSNDSGVVTERDPDSVRGADVAYFSYTRLPANVEVEVYPRTAPELAVEVRSPSERWSELHAKVAEYLAAGVIVVAIVDRDTRTVSLYYANKPSVTLLEHDSLTLSEIFEDFSVPVARIFEGV